MADKLGKIDRFLFDNIIQLHCGKERAEVLTGPGFGVDVSVIDLGGGMSMAATSDPLSLIPSLGLEESAWLSVHLAANDIATTGFGPMYAQFVLNLPANFTKEDFKVYWDYIHKFSKEINLTITGGHTGFIEGQNSTIAGGTTFFSFAPTSQILTSQKATVGDAILVTKECAISSAAILAMSFPKKVIAKVGKENHGYASELFYRTSSLNDALTAIGKDKRDDGITAMHDVTEGGVLGAIYELAIASGKGARVFKEDLPVSEAVQQICSLFAIDPHHCVGAGSMIITCKQDKVNAVIQRLKGEGISCTRVGEIKEKGYGIKLADLDGEDDMMYMETDPYWAAFFNAMHKGWK